MKIKTADLIDAPLDWAVAIITNPEWTDEDRWYNTFGYVDCGDPDDEPYSPSTDWRQGGPIIEREGGTLWSTNAVGWRCKARYDFANDKEGVVVGGPTPLIAACRCFVASRFGDEVDIPEELLT